jgi:hypothetical protein
MKTLSIQLSNDDYQRFIKLKSNPNDSNTETFLKLLNLHSLNNSQSLRYFKSILSSRIYLGVGYSFICELRLLYTLIGHFLKKARYI